MSYTEVGPVQVKDIDAVKAAVDDVRNDATETNFLVLGYEAGKPNTIELVASGKGGLAEMKTYLAPDFLGYCYLRVISGDLESRRPKFISISFSGENVGLVKKGKMGTHVSAISSLFIYSHIHVQASLPSDLEEEDLMSRVKKASGADYDSGSNRGGYVSKVAEIKSEASHAYSQQ